MQKRLLLPNLRFPDFINSIGWGFSHLSKFIKTLDAGVSVNSGDRPASNGESGVLKTSCVTNGCFDVSENKVVLDLKELGRLKESVSQNTIIISRMNTPALVGANAYVDSDCNNIFLPDRLWAAKPKPEGYLKFIAQILGSEQGRKALSELATGTSGSMKNISKLDILNLRIAAPELPEQKKIADCLSSIDELISAEARKLDALKAHKKGLMQQLLPAEGETVPRLRFPEFREAGEWRVGNLSDVVTIKSGTTPLRSESKYYEGGTIPWVKTMDLNNSFITQAEECITPAARARINPVGSVLVAMYGGFNQIGRTGYLKIPAATNQAISVLNARDRNIESLYLQIWLNAKVDCWRKIASSSRKDPNITSADVGNFPFCRPYKDEQNKISKAISSVDKVISKQEIKIENLKAHKKGLMQQLFPAMDEMQE